GARRGRARGSRGRPPPVPTPARQLAQRRPRSAGAPGSPRFLGLALEIELPRVLHDKGSPQYLLHRARHVAAPALVVDDEEAGPAARQPGEADVRRKLLDLAV